MTLASGIGRILRYIHNMACSSHHFKRIAAAVCFAVGFSLPAVADQARVDDLLAQLREAEGIQAARIAVEIRNEWSKSGSATLDLLLRRGEDALDAGDPVSAIEHFTAAIDHDPTYLEAYNGRATAYYLNDDLGPALGDLRYMLAQNPQHFDALRGFGIVMFEMDRPEDALEVLRQVQDMYPADETTAEYITELELMLEGQAL